MATLRLPPAPSHASAPNGQRCSAVLRMQHTMSMSQSAAFVVGPHPTPPPPLRLLAERSPEGLGGLGQGHQVVVAGL